MGLGTSLSYVGSELSISSTDKMQDHVIDLYAEVFKFLCQAFEWFSSKSYRLKTAFNDKYATTKVKLMVTNITQIVSNIRYEAEQSSRSKINNLTTGMEHLENKLDKLKLISDDMLLQLRMIAHQKEQDPIDIKELLTIVLGRFASSTLQAVEQHTLHGRSRLSSRGVYPLTIIRFGAIFSGIWKHTTCRVEGRFFRTCPFSS